MRFSSLTLASFLCAISTLLVNVSPVHADEVSLLVQFHQLQGLSAGDAEPFVIAPDCYSPAKDSNRKDNAAAAEKYMVLGRMAAEQGDAALCVRCAHAALSESQACEEAATLLGYEFDNKTNTFVTPWQERMSKTDREWNTKFGWLKPDEVQRYQAGERRLAGRWVSGEQDAARHARIDQGWQVRTDHYIVTTNHSLEAGVKLAAQLEALRSVWWQLFADMAIDDRQLKRVAVSNRTLVTNSRPMQVVFHRTRQQYVSELRARQPQIEVTLGIYFDRFREAHFFAGEEDTIATLYHEATHQLFQEGLDAVRSPGKEANFWAIEAAALYFESLQVVDVPNQGPVYVLGGANQGRLPAARYRWIESRYRVPLSELVELGRRDMQSRDDLAPLYSQLAGMGHFFLSADNPERRKKFAQFLTLVYQGKDDAGSLGQTMGTSLRQLDQQYGEWIEAQQPEQ